MSNSVDKKAFKKAIKQEWCTNEKQIKYARELLEAYEQAKQPVRVDLDECVDAYLSMTHYSTTEHSALDITKSVLAIVKDAAKEMGVEVTYEGLGR